MAAEPFRRTLRCLGNRQPKRLLQAEEPFMTLIDTASPSLARSSNPLIAGARVAGTERRVSHVGGQAGRGAGGLGLRRAAQEHEPGRKKAGPAEWLNGHESS